MEFFKRIWNAVQVIVEGVVTFVTGPFQMLVKGSDSGTVRVATVIGAAVRVFFVLSFIMAVPSFIMTFAIFWLTVSLYVHVFLAVILVATALLTPSWKFEEEAKNVFGIEAEAEAA